jgi:hypothetical protein
MRKAFERLVCRKHAEFWKVARGVKGLGSDVKIGKLVEVNDLLPALEEGKRGKRYNTALTMEMKNVRAISQAG